MATVYRTLSYTTASVASGASTSRNDTIASNLAYIYKVKVVPSVGGAGENTKVEIFKRDTFSAGDLVYATNNFIGNLIDPIQNDGVTTTERNEGPVAMYEDLDSTQEFHLKITNNGTVSRTFDVTITYLAGQDVRGYIDVKKDFGATGDGSTNDTTTIQAAITAAGSGEKIYFPPGTYKVGALTWDKDVTLEGAGKNTTKLQSNAASTMLTLAPGSLTFCHGRILNMSLDGNSVGTIGISIANITHFSIERCIIENFITKGVYSEGALIFQMEKCIISNNVIGVDGTDSASLDANLVAFRDCVFINNTTYGLQWTDGALLILEGCDIELNGTAGNAATGGMKVGAMCPFGEGVALIVDKCWFEENHGHSAIRINAPTGGASTAHHIVTNSHIITGTRTYGFYVEGATYFAAQNLVAQNAGTADFFTGSSTIGSFFNCIATATSISGTVTLYPDPTNVNNATLFGGNLTATIKAAATVLDHASAQLGIRATPQSGVTFQSGSLDGTQTSGNLINRFGAIDHSTAGSRGAGFSIVTQNVAAGAANNVDLNFGFRNDANTGEGPRCLIRATKGAGVNTALLEFQAANTTAASTPGIYIDGSATANDTRLLVYDVTAGAYRRVTIGANDSGGAGFRLLRIPN